MGLFISWWYGEEFQSVLQYFETFLAYLYDLFSVKICLSTLFSVWRRDKIGYKGLALKDAFQAWTLNLASRFIGFMVKMVTMLVYLIVTIFALIFMLFFVIGWLIFPLLILGLIYLGFSHMIG